MHNNNGFVLVAVLILLMILSLLSVNALERTLIQYQQTASQALENKLLINVQNVVCKIAKQLESNDGKLINKKVLQSDLLNELWWRAHGIRFKENEIIIEAVVKKIATNACFKVSNAKNSGVDYYQINLRSFFNEDDFQMILQVILLLPSKENLLCPNQEIKPVKGGLISWNEL